MTKYFGFYGVHVHQDEEGLYQAKVWEDVTGITVYEGPVLGTVRTLNDAANGIARWLGLTT